MCYIFVDTSVWMYAVGGPHPLRNRAHEALRRHVSSGSQLITSAEVLQEVLHAYLPVQRASTMDATLTLAQDLADVVSLDDEDVALARDLFAEYPGLSARDLIHLACCTRRGIDTLLSFDQSLSAAFDRTRP